MSRKQKIITFFVGLVILTSIFAVAIHTLTANNTIGTDFLVFYLAGRSSFIEGQGPYVAENNLISQLSINDRPADPTEDQLTFSYPPYVLLAILPLVYLPFTWAQAIWMGLLLVLLVMLPMFMLPRAPRWAIATIFLLYPFTFGLILGNFAVPIGIFLVAVYLVIFHTQEDSNGLADTLAGICLAWCTAKPQFSWLIILFLLVAALKFRRWRLIASFSIATVIFLGISFIILPTWPMDWINQVAFYAQTNRTLLHLTLLLQLVFSESITNILTPILASLGLIWTGYMLWRWWQGKSTALNTLCWVALISYLVHPRGVAYEQITFLIPFLIWIFTPEKNSNNTKRVITWIIAIITSWLGFYSSRFASSIHALPEWILAFYIIWMGIYLNFWQKNDPSTKQPFASSLKTIR